jgi:hypothetical protein
MNDIQARDGGTPWPRIDGGVAVTVAPTDSR